MDFEKYQSNQENKAYKIFTGMVISIDSEKQLMNVAVNGVGVQRNIAINNPTTPNGVGIRVMPVPGTSTVLLYEQKSTFYHIGYYYNHQDDSNVFMGLQSFTNNSIGDKNESDIIFLQRNLASGELSIAGSSNAEIYLPNSGDILLINSARASIELSSILNAVLVDAESTYSEIGGTVFRNGNVLRRVKGSQKDLEGIFSASNVVTPESYLTTTESFEKLNEFSFDVGTTESDSTGYYDDSIQPTVGRFSLANIVIDNDGSPVFEDSQTLNFLLDITATNIRLCSDTIGNFKIIDTTPNKPSVDGLVFTVGEESNFSISINDSNISANYKNEVELSNLKSKVSISSIGTISLKNNRSDTHFTEINSITLTSTGIITLQNKDKDGNIINKLILSADGSYTMLNKNSEISVTASGAVSITSKETIQILSNGETVAQPSVLGNNVVSFLTDFLTNYSTHFHPTSIGPTTPSAQAAAFVGTATTQYLTPGVATYTLSQKTSNN